MSADANPGFTRLAWILWILFVIRCLANAWLLEPTNDEGLWLWNARCETLNVDSMGILHAALSPGSYGVFKLLFQVVPVSIPSIRFFNVALGAASLALWIIHLGRRGAPTGAAALALWWLCDPFLFRAASWVYLEPSLLLLITLAVVGQPRLMTSSGGWLALGAIIGMILAIKITCAWIVGLLAVPLTRRAQRAGALAALASALVMAALAYGSVWLTHNQQDFAHVWRVHSQSRLSPGSGLWHSLASLDLRPLIYWGLILGAASLAVFHRRAREMMKPVAPAVLLGTGFFLMQAIAPERYLCPLAMLGLAGLCHLIQPWAAKLPARWGALAVVAALAANATLYPKLVMRPPNAGGRELAKKVETAARDGLAVAAPAHLSIGAFGPVVPSSSDYTIIRPPAGFVPDMFILQDIAAEQNNTDPAFTASFESAGINGVRFGRFYLAYIRE